MNFTPPSRSVVSSAFSGCGCLFFGAFFLAGLFALVILLAFVVYPTWDAYRRYVPTEGEIVQGRIREEFKESASYYPELLVRYTPANGPRRETWGYRVVPQGITWHPEAWEVIDRFPIGQKVSCWYDPLDPNRMVLERGMDWLMLLFVPIPLFFMGIGVWGMRNFRNRAPEISREAAALEAKAKGKESTSGPILLAIGGVFFVAGVAVMYGLFVGQILPERRAASTFVETKCEILDSRLLTFRGDDSVTYRPEFKIRYRAPAFPDPAETWTYRITNVSSSSHAGERAVLDQFQRGKEYPCWYDPDRPRRVVIDRSGSWFGYLMLLLPTAFLGVGGLLLVLGYNQLPARKDPFLDDAVDPFAATAGGAWQSSTAAPARDDTMFQPAAERAAFTGPSRSAPLAKIPPRGELPNVPTIDLSNCRGETLRYRLPAGVSMWAQVIVLSCFALFWNFITGIFVIMAINSHIQGKPEWFLTVFISPFVLVGAVLIFFTIRQSLVAWGVRPTILEISDHPLALGDRAAVLIVQPGPLTVNSLVLSLTCSESATFRQGTSTRTETALVYSAEVVRRDAFEIAQGLPLELRAEVNVPEQGMHSLSAGHNSIQWKLVVKGDLAGWPDFEAEFPVVVQPRVIRNLGTVTEDS